MSTERQRRRRTPNACDFCKSRKIRCDSTQKPGNRCTNCVVNKIDCTHAATLKTSASAQSYVESLEARLEKLEKLLSKAMPGVDLTEQFERDQEPNPLVNSETLPRNDAHEEPSISTLMRKLTLNPEKTRFFGKSSGIYFVQAAWDFKSSVPQAMTHNSDVPLPKRRDEFWEPAKWVYPTPGDDDQPQYQFPPSDLIPDLVDLYFTQFNCYHPILHRPTFERKLKDHLHLQDHRFAATLLLVCSLGGKCSDDPRVFLDSGADRKRTGGWKWHSQVRVIPRHLIYKPNLYELQAIALSSLFLLTVSPLVAWNQIGFGLRRAQDVGAHRSMKQSVPTPEHEQWKRVFWVLVCLDWFSGAAAGRPFATQAQDTDQEKPYACDDEYWELPEPHRFRQPKDKPAEICYFICYAKLLEIQASVINAIYSPGGPVDLFGRQRSSDVANIVAFDSQLNSWFLDIPPHLVWDPDRKNRLHLKQSAFLHTAFYLAQILVHRPFITVSTEITRSAELPSLAICTNAARSCSRIIQTLNELEIEAHQNMLLPASTSATVLLLNIWNTKRNSGVARNMDKEMADVLNCRKMLSSAEERYQAAGRSVDVLDRLMSAGDMDAEAFFFKPFTNYCAPPAPQEGYEPSVFASPSESFCFASVEGDFHDGRNKRVEEDTQRAFYSNSSNSDWSQAQQGIYPEYHDPTEVAPSVDQFAAMDWQRDFSFNAFSSAASSFQYGDWESYVMNTGIPPNDYLQSTNPLHHAATDRFLSSDDSAKTEERYI
ncbi:Zn(2)-C6 fungal-type domain-containing protein [Favolaschia claudopus]|uniref:Zn(2)-C6 fungal-type domain-containing protein n=1 Tax=Favolaschia claudopus TaxID=2862362 RepID=A0AAW0B3D6_9AGAR